MIKCLLRGGLLYTRWIDVARSHKGTLRIYIYKPWKIGDPDVVYIFRFSFFLSLSLSRFIYFVFLFLYLEFFRLFDYFSDSSCIHFPSLHIGRTRFAGSSSIDRFHAERRGKENKKYRHTHNDVHTQRCTWHINIYSIIMEGPDRVLAISLSFLFEFFFLFLSH